MKNLISWRLRRATIARESLAPAPIAGAFWVATGLIALKRAGADSVLAYFPIRIAEKLKKGGI